MVDIKEGDNDDAEDKNANNGTNNFTTMKLLGKLSGLNPPDLNARLTN